MQVDRIRTFSFVDRIIAIDNPTLIKGTFTIPSVLVSFSQCLVAEAIGQLAAWYAMKSLEFAYRPVAALAGTTRYHAEARPGEKLDLFVQIESCNAETISYSGYAKSGNCLVMELKDCAGAILPQAEFDDPATVEEHYKQLLADGVQNTNLDLATCLGPTDIRIDKLHYLRGRLDVPLYADFFLDHFPKKPIFPATLLIQALCTMVITYVSDAESSCSISVAAVKDVKVRGWMHPGDQLELLAIDLSSSPSTRLFKVSTHRDGRLIATAKLVLDVGDSSVVS